MLHRMLSQVIRSRPKEQRSQIREGLREAMKQAAKPDDLFAEFEALDSVWTPPARTGFEPAQEAAAR
jgi:hypothetical protein